MNCEPKQVKIKLLNSDLEFNLHEDGMWSLIDHNSSEKIVSKVENPMDINGLAFFLANVARHLMK